MSRCLARHAPLACATILLGLSTLGDAAGAQVSEKQVKRQAKTAQVASVLGGRGGLRLATNGRTISVVVTDTGVAIPESTTEGLANFRLIERGKSLVGRHRVFVRRLPYAMPFEDVKRAVAEGRLESLDLPALGGPGVPDSTGRSDAAFELRPGRYLVGVATIDAGGRQVVSPKSVGMLQAIRITRFTTPAPPPAQAVVRLRDSAIEIPSVLPVGRYYLQIENAGRSERGLVIRRLEPGASKSEAMRWLSTRKGEAPFSYVASVSPMSPSRTVYTLVLMEAGDYLFGSDVPGASHGAGEMKVVRVK